MLDCDPSQESTVDIKVWDSGELRISPFSGQRCSTCHIFNKVSERNLPLTFFMLVDKAFVMMLPKKK